jgi:hypothetical protein
MPIWSDPRLKMVYVGVWDKPISRARVGQTKLFLRAEAQLRAEGKVFTDSPKIVCMAIYW